MATQTKPTYRSLLQAIICDRYADRDAALRAIEQAFERREITTEQLRDLERRIG